MSRASPAQLAERDRLLPPANHISEACRHLDSQLVIALAGKSSSSAPPALPGNPLVVNAAPHMELPQRAALSITHAGLNTVLESLSSAMPVLAIPNANDQRGVAARLAWSGSSAVLPLKRATVTRLRAAIDRVLSDTHYKQNVQRLQPAITASCGVARAADIV